MHTDAARLLVRAAPLWAGVVGLRCCRHESAVEDIRQARSRGAVARAIDQHAERSYSLIDHNQHK